MAKILKKIFHYCSKVWLDGVYERIITVFLGQYASKFLIYFGEKR